MKISNHPNTSHNWKCPICQTSDDKPVVLIGISGTERDRIIEAEQFHLECINLLYYTDENILTMKILPNQRSEGDET